MDWYTYISVCHVTFQLPIIEGKMVWNLDIVGIIRPQKSLSLSPKWSFLELSSSLRWERCSMKDKLSSVDSSLQVGGRSWVERFIVSSSSGLWKSTSIWSSSLLHGFSLFFYSYHHCYYYINNGHKFQMMVPGCGNSEKLHVLCH